MVENESTSDQREVWNEWNAASREADLGQISLEQAAVVEGWFASLDANQSWDILEVGCGTGWMCQRLTKFGRVTGTDLADEVVDRARKRSPEVRFIAGDFLEVDFGTDRFDVVVSLETMTHFVDQNEFLRRISKLLRPGGILMLGVQNRPVMERNLRHIPSNGWYRHWVDHRELRALLEPYFLITELGSITPTYFSGPLHVLNSRKLASLAGKVGLAKMLKYVRRTEERHFMGWTLMCLSTNRQNSE